MKINLYLNNKFDLKNFSFLQCFKVIRRIKNNQKMKSIFLIYFLVIIKMLSLKADEFDEIQDQELAFKLEDDEQEQQQQLQIQDINEFDKKDNWHSKKKQLLKSLIDMYQSKVSKLQNVLAESSSELDKNVEIVKHSKLNERKPFKWG